LVKPERANAVAASATKTMSSPYSDPTARLGRHVYDTLVKEQNRLDTEAVLRSLWR
jgi:hypothetical protein